MADPNLICGRRPTFGDRQQIAKLKLLQKQAGPKKRYRVEVEYSIPQKEMVEVVAQNEDELDRKLSKRFGGDCDYEVLETTVEKAKPPVDTQTIDIDELIERKRGLAKGTQTKT